VIGFLGLYRLLAPQFLRRYVVLTFLKICPLFPVFPGHRSFEGKFSPGAPTHHLDFEARNPVQGYPDVFPGPSSAALLFLFLGFQPPASTRPFLAYLITRLSVFILPFLLRPLGSGALW